MKRAVKSIRRMIHQVWLAPVRGYQRWISPFTPPSCRYSPSCSQYAIDAVTHRGIVRGTLLAAWRIIRCNPLFAGGHDPVLTCDPEHPHSHRALASNAKCLTDGRAARKV